MASTHAESGNAPDNGGVLGDEEGVVGAGDGVVRAARAAETLGSHCEVCCGFGVMDGFEKLTTLAMSWTTEQPKFRVTKGCTSHMSGSWQPGSAKAAIR